MDKMKLYVISHTHWDREWYQEFQYYRYRLVRMMDDLLDLMERQPAYKYFHLDGQTIVLQDYLAIRPENEQRLRRLIEAGRIIIGPWYVMPDEFLSSGETLVKNLQTGFALCAKYGAAPMQNGYVTDIFGHNSQFPQILRQFGIESATLYRGIGDYDRDTFLWQAPDGSQVYAYKLDRERSYSNFYFAVRYPYENEPFDPEDAVRRMKQLLAHMKELSVTDMTIMMDGVDHIDADEQVLELMELFEREIPDVEFIHARLDDYLPELKRRQLNLDVLEGALYHVAYEGVNNQVLKNVLSSTIHLKQANDQCERLLTRFAQPLDAFTKLMKPQLRPWERNEYYAHPRQGYFAQAWDFLLQNEPHDSICGCSTSDVHRDNAYRFRQCRQIAEMMTEDAMREIAANVLEPAKAYTGQILVYNPSQQPCGSVFLTQIEIPAGHQHNLRFYDADGRPVRVQLLRMEPRQQAIHSLRHLISFRMMERWEAAIEMDVPPLGYAVLGYESLQSRGPEHYSYGYAELHHPQRLTGSLRTGKDTFDNGVLELKVQPNGALQVTDKPTGRVYRDLMTFEDCADVGDGWNYRKPHSDSQIFDCCSTGRYSVESDGPLATAIRIDKTLELPVSYDYAENRRSETTGSLLISTWIFLLKGERVLSFRTKVHNQQVNHRLRVLFPTDMETDHFVTKLPFDMYTWNIQPEAYADRVEEETFVHPSQGITFIGDGQTGAAVFTRGLYEVEVTDDRDRSLAVTLFRSVTNETGRARAQDAKLLADLTLEYAFYPGCPSAEEALLAGEQWRAGCSTFYFDGEGTDLSRKGTGSLPRRASFLQLEGGSAVLSSVAATDSGALEVRVYDVSGRASEITLRLARPITAACLVDLKGDVLEELSVSHGQTTFSLPPHKIVTVRCTCA